MGRESEVPRGILLKGLTWESHLNQAIEEKLNVLEKQTFVDQYG